MNKMNSQITKVKNHLPFPEEVFSTTHARHPGRAIINRNVFIVTTNVQIAPASNPHCRTRPCKVQYGPGITELITNP